MATPPDFVAGAVLTAAQMNKIGMWLIKADVIGTGVSSVVVTDVFSADFDNYRIVMSGGSASTNNVINLTLGSTVTGYSWYSWGRQAGAGVSADSSNTTSMLFGNGSTAFKSGSVDVLNPFAADETMFINGFYLQTGTLGAFSVGGYLNNTTSYTGFTLTPNTGTLTGGTVYVYGYNNG